LPSSPKLLINLLVALVLGLGIGAGVLFLLEQFDEGVADPAEIETTLGVPLLGTIPKSDDGDIFAALADPKESVSEAYFSLQTALGFATDHGFPRTLAVTSSKPAEGKSTSSFALAKSLARPGRKTILIDGDLRSPSIHLMLGLDRTSGVSNYLAGSDDVDSLIQPTAYPDLFAMAAGPQPPSAAELLASDRLQRLLAELRERFDHVIIDAPPVMGIADAPIIGSRVEGSVFVMEAHGTKKGVARVAVARMQAAKAVVMGVILTKFDAKRANYGYGYDYGYGYGYGDQARGASET
jgi:capsular exopolysaccharide synthesis family protein